MARTAIASRQTGGLRSDGPGFNSRSERCIYRASRPSQGTDTDTDNINRELEKNKYLVKYKLSLNVNKSKFMIFHCPQRKINIPVLKINDTTIECVENFDLL